MERSLRDIAKQKSLSITRNSMQLPIFLVVVVFILVIILLDIQALHISSPLSSSSSTWSSSLQQWVEGFTKMHRTNCSKELQRISTRLRDSVTFLPLKDLRFADTAMDGHTWFMSSLNDTMDEDEAEYLYFPSDASKGRLLCISGHDMHDGGKNSYGFAWEDSLPDNAKLLGDLTYVSDTYYDYGNLWHGLSAVAPFVGWYRRKGCEKPSRWVLFHKGEIRTGMGSWVQNLMEATFGEVNVETLDSQSGPFCFEKAVVMRHNLGKMGKENRFLVYDLLKCKARMSCNVTDRIVKVTNEGLPVIRLTLLMRKGPRSFKNESAVIRIFEKECAKVDGCTLTVSQSENLSFCDQVRLMSFTDILASPHGAQMTNMVFMDRNSSVMEFFPKGWLELAGPGKYAHHWMASHSGMQHQGAWWDTESEIKCPYPENDSRCFSFYKSGKVGHNETFFTEWAKTVINQAKMSKLHEISKTMLTQSQLNSSICSCG